MEININKKISLKKGLLVIPVFSDTPPKAGLTKKRSASGGPHYPTAIKNFLALAVKHDKFKANFGSTILTHLYDKNLPRRLLVIGLGKKANFKASKARVIGAKISKQQNNQRRI